LYIAKRASEEKTEMTNCRCHYGLLFSYYDCIISCL